MARARTSTREIASYLGGRDPDRRTFGNAGKGRPRGSLNKATKQAKAMAESLMDAPYWRSVKRRMREGRAPHLEVLYAHYLFGKPRDRVKIEVDAGHDGLSLVELANMMTDEELAVIGRALQRVKEGRPAPVTIGRGATPGTVNGHTNGTPARPVLPTKARVLA